MTAYLTSSYFGQDLSSTRSVAILAGSYALRIAKIEWVTSDGGGSPLAFYRYSGAGLSGGSALTIGPLRDGAPAASATAKTNATISGTSTLLYSATELTNSVGAYQFAFDVLVAPGNAFYVLNTKVSGNYNLLSMGISFEELRLAWSA